MAFVITLRLHMNFKKMLNSQMYNEKEYSAIIIFLKKLIIYQNTFESPSFYKTILLALKSLSQKSLHKVNNNESYSERILFL